MPEVGLEPTRPRGHRILSPARLPIPPLRPASAIVSAFARSFAAAQDRIPVAEEGPGTDTSATLIQPEEDEPVKSRAAAIAFALLVAVLALAAAGCGGDDNESEGTTTEASGGGGGNAGAVEALPASSCSAVYYEGDGDPDYLIASDLPLQGAGRTQTIEMTKAIKFVLKQRNFKIGK